MRSTQYISPKKGDSAYTEACDGILQSDVQVEMEQYFRRINALEEVPGWMTAAQRSARARAKRKAGVPAAPRAKRAMVFERA